MTKILIALGAVLGGALVLYFIFFNRQAENRLARTKSQVREVVEPILKPEVTPPPVASGKVLTGGSHTFQTFNNCGPASLSMILSYYGIKASQYELGDILRPYQHARGDNDDKSTAFEEMENLSKNYGFTPYLRPAGDIKMIKSFINLGIPVMVKTLKTTEEDIAHFRVIKGYDDVSQTIIQDDSLQGKNLSFTYDEFNKLWEAFSYRYMVLVPTDKVDVARAILAEDVDEKAAWEKVLRNSTSELNRVVALYRLGRYQEAADLFDSIRASLPKRTLWYQIEPVLAYQKTAQYDKVFEIATNLIENGNRAYSEIYQIRGEIYESQGKVSEAKAEFEKVYLYNKNFYKYWE